MNSLKDKVLSRKVTSQSSDLKAKPFLKWLGGKWQLIDQIEPFFPTKFNNYFEPFLGGGAIFFHLKPKNAFLNDINETLVKTYTVIKEEPEKIIKLLGLLQRRYITLDEEGRREMYQKVRTDFNTLNSDNIKKAAYLIFLNKTCFNGVYRENSLGEFNVPFGKNKNPKILDIENIQKVSNALGNATITNGNFKDILGKAKKGDFVYLDPPYYPISKTSSFTKYAEQDFSENNQEEVREMFEELDYKGCFVLLSNSFSPYIKNLYKGFNFKEINANRALNCKAEGRGKIKEYLIMNY